MGATLAVATPTLPKAIGPAVERPARRPLALAPTKIRGHPSCRDQHDDEPGGGESGRSGEEREHHQAHDEPDNCEPLRATLDGLERRLRDSLGQFRVFLVELALYLLENLLFSPRSAARPRPPARVIRVALYPRAAFGLRGLRAVTTTGFDGRRRCEAGRITAPSPNRALISSGCDGSGFAARMLERDVGGESAEEPEWTHRGRAAGRRVCLGRSWRAAGPLCPRGRECGRRARRRSAPCKGAEVLEPQFQRDRPAGYARGVRRALSRSQ